MDSNWWEQTYWNNEVWRYIAVAGFILAGIIAGAIFKRVLLRLSARQEQKAHSISAVLFQALAKSLVFIGFAIGQNFAFDLTTFPEGIEKFQEVSSDLLVLIAIARLGWFLIAVPEAWVMALATRNNNALNSMIAPMIRNCLRTLVLLLTIIQGIQIISNQDFTTIIAGLGVGAVAIALASQQSVANFFGSVVLFINRPFDMGDRIVFGGNDGTVEEVGIMCTKQRTLEGHLVTIPNGQLSDGLIRNIAKRPNIRQIHNVTITYDTPPEKIKRATAIIKELLENHEGMQEDFPPRVYFNNLNADSLNIIVIFWYHPPNYWDFLEFNQRFLQSLFERYAEEGIDFAFPSQTVYLAGDEKRPLEIGLRSSSGRLTEGIPD